MSNLASVGEIIRELRKEKAYTQKELAEKVHKSNTTISKIETGELSPTLEDLTNIASVLGTNIGYILRDTVKEEDYQLAVIKSLIERVVRITTLNEYFNKKDSTILNPDESIFSLLDDVKNPLIVQMDKSLIDFVREIAEIENLKQELNQHEYENRISSALRKLHKTNPGEEVDYYCLASIQDIESIIEKAVKKELDGLRAMPGTLCGKANTIKLKLEKPGRSN